MRVSRVVRNVSRPSRVLQRSARSLATVRIVPQTKASFGKFVLAGAVGLAGAAVLLAEEPKVDYKAVEQDIRNLIEQAAQKKYDDGSYGPLFIRLAWHSAGNYSKYDKTGGSNGATMRFAPEANHGGNAGLGVARNLLEDIKKKYPGLSYADLYTLAGTVAVEALNGPKCKWRPGRRDETPQTLRPTPDGRLPDASQGADHLRAIFYRMGFSDQEIVALSGAHSLGRCHTDRSGFEGPWTNNPTMFSNDYFRLLLDEKWTERNWKGPRQFQDSSGKLMMLPSDLALTDDPAFRVWVKTYANDEELFFKDFAAAWSKLLELGVEFKPKSVWEKLF